jgi:RNA polymerase sigma factor for flagellar operon FliA
VPSGSLNRCSTDDLAARIGRKESIAELREAIGELPEKDRPVLTLYYFEGLNLRQISEVLHVTDFRVSQIRAWAISRLRGRLGIA